MRRAAAAAVALALLAPACTKDEPEPPKVVVATVFLERLSAAIRDVNTARKRLADDGAVLGAAALALDDVDEVAVTGDRKAARDRRPKAAGAVQKAAPIVRRLNEHVRTYQRAVTALSAAEAPGLTPEQLAALRNAVQAGRDELNELQSYATAVTSVWTRYEKLDADQKTWVSRAYNGWYRTTEESADAYVVMTERPKLAAARRTFASADQRRVQAGRTATERFDKARATLSPLLS